MLPYLVGLEARDTSGWLLGRLSACEGASRLCLLVPERAGAGRAPAGCGLAPPGRATLFVRRSERYFAAGGSPVNNKATRVLFREVLTKLIVIHVGW